ncbi:MULTISPECIES: hypothetical protein [unclassified Thalassospira]|uniref:hypothetical protein n=1 Tax=unclassified Thalassospira TaxID=2648997 RepID=UPI0007A61E55|nr:MULTISPECIES: hypothetical protein [unclassified Thalassospira]KZC99698.1 hypothetical protein AUQ41_08450 [Thalassospira sp. MCCC 1A02898]ONH85376.1 hypothetical protein TH47_05895 [Thalassospira sp. MCCC 1A02803]
MDTALGRDNAAYLTPVFAAAEYDLTAGAGTDNTEQTWATIDRLTAFDNVRHASAVATVAVTATLAEGETSITTGIWEHSVDGSTWVEIGTDTTMLTLTGGSGGSTETGAADLNINLAEANQYVRFKQTTDLSASGTDTAKVSGVYIFSAPSEI